jgi:DNA primase
MLPKPSNRDVQKYERNKWIDKVKRYINVNKILKHYNLINFTKSGQNWLNGSCPLPSHNGPDNNPSFGIYDKIGDDRNGNFKCFKCGKGDIIKFISIMEKLDFKNTIQFMNRFRATSDPYSLGALEKELSELKEDEEENEIEIKATYIPHIQENMGLISKYMIEDGKRNFHKRDICNLIKNYYIGVSYYRGAIRIIVPIADEHGRWVTFFAQNPNDNPDKLFPRKAQTGSLLFGIDKWVGKSDYIVLTEGVWDALKVAAFGYPSVASFSASFTEKQGELISEYFNTVYVAFDMDEAGEKGFINVANSLFPIINIYRIKMPKKDPCLCSRKEFIRAFNRAEKLEYHEEIN